MPFNFPEHKQLKKFLIALIFILLGVVVFTAISFYQKVINTPVAPETGKRESAEDLVPTPPTTEEAKKGLEAVSGSQTEISSEAPPIPPGESEMRQQLEKISKSASGSETTSSPPVPPTEDEAKKQFEMFENN